MSNATGSNGRTRKQLADQLDRLDVILDGLADALNESVADAVRDVVGQVVREAVETTIREVLGNPELLRAALAAHTPPAPPQRPRPRPHFEAARNALSALLRKARQAAGVAKATVASARTWALSRVRAAAGLACGTGRALWRCRAAAVVAVGSGVAAGVGVYHAGPALASVLCGIGSTALTAVGFVLWPLWRLVRGTSI
jgi:hypothetical protein